MTAPYGLRLIAFTISLVITQSVIAGSPSGATFVPIGDLAGGDFESFAWGVSADGLTVVGSGIPASTDPFSLATYWTATGGLVSLPITTTFNPPAESLAASADGTVVVGYLTAPTQGISRHAFRWTMATGTVTLGAFPGGQNRSRARAVSADGSIVVGEANITSGMEVFRWTQATGIVSLGDLEGGSTNGSAYGISGDGTIIVGRGVGFNGTEAFRWTQADGMVGLGDVTGGSFSSAANAISADGNVIVGTGTNSSNSIAVRWVGAGSIEVLSGQPFDLISSQAFGTAENGSVIVGSFVAASEQGAFIWSEPLGLRSVRSLLEIEFGLDLTGWELAQARGISGDGRTIVGFGLNAALDPEGWVVTLPYELGSDCNQNGLADGIELYSGSSADCNDNSKPDECDIIDGIADANSNMVLDICEVEPPLGATSPHDRRKNRYVSFAPNHPGQSFAYRISKATGSPGMCWVGPPDMNGNAACQAAPAFRVWTEQNVHVGDCEIVPVATYDVHATPDGVIFSGPVAVHTIDEPILNQKKWGDVVGTNSGSEWT